MNRKDQRKGTAWKRSAALLAAFCLAAVLLTPLTLVKAEEEPKNVLFISSYSLSYPTVSKQIEGIRKGLGSDVYLYYEFMNSKTITGDEYVAKFYDYLSYKYSKTSGIDAVIVGDDDALQMALRYSSGFFQDKPVIYEAVNSQTRAQLADSLGMAGVAEHDTIEDTMDMAVRLFPKADSILAITDESNTGQALTATLKAIRSRYAPVEIEILDTSSLTSEQIMAAAAGADSSTVILYMSLTRDADGNSYTGEKALKLISSNTNAPILGLVWLANGMLGSVEADYAKIGQTAGEMAVKCMNGTSPAQLHVQDDSPTVTTFDAGIMKKLGITKSRLAADTVYVNDDSSSARVLAVIAALCAGMIILLLLLNHSRMENKKHKDNEIMLQKNSEILKTEAEMDGLTGLGNRRSLDAALARATKTARCFRLYLIDLDEFKHVNDTYGHLSGDAVLREVGNRLNSLKERRFVPYRYGGDEFAVMSFRDLQEEADTESRQILDLFQADVITEKETIPVHISIGSACFPADADEAESLIHCADLALYHIKKSGKNNACDYGSLTSEQRTGSPES